MGSLSTDSINHVLKIFRKKKMARKQDKTAYTDFTFFIFHKQYSIATIYVTFIFYRYLSDLGDLEYRGRFA